jgi:hypothetical protein
MQLQKEDPDHVDEGMIFTFRSPIYKMFEYIETSELYKAANVMQMAALEKLDDINDIEELKDKLDKLDKIDDYENTINEALNKLDEHYEELPLLLKYGLIVYKISEDPETQEFNNKGSNLFCEMFNAMLGPNRLDPEKYVKGMLNVSIKGLETLSEIPDQYKKFQDLFDQIPGLKLVEPIEYYNQIEALSPIPSIPIIVEAAIFSHHISDF